MFNLTQKDISRFWSKVDKKGKKECWLWTDKSKHWNGYGLFTIATGKPGGKKVAASRISCFLVHGRAPEGKPHALHSCDNPPCCNPNHLRWGHQGDNVQDAKERNRHVDPPRTHDNPEWNAKRLAAMPQGDQVWNQSLTEELVRKVWALHFEGKSGPEISSILGVKKHPVIDVCRGRSWRHLSDAPSIEDLKAAGVTRGFNQFSRGGNTRDLHSTAKLSSAQVVEIKKLFDEGHNWRDIASQYNVSKCTVYKARKEAIRNGNPP